MKSEENNINKSPDSRLGNSVGSHTQWTFGYPKCINKQEGRLVCLHKDCQKYPFFCSNCDDESCENQHQHQDRITSIGFKQLIKKLIIDRKPPEQLEKAINNYKSRLQELQQNVAKFVQAQTKTVNQILQKSMELQNQDEQLIKKLKEKQYQTIKGKQLDHVWKKIIPDQKQKKRQKQMIEFIDSKRVEVEQLKEQFKAMPESIDNKLESQQKEKSKINANQTNKRSKNNSRNN